ncbi:MAG: hypothetical protein ACI9JN_000156 [Bacteroidia bacterium]|jgi:hypothetical protein
MKSVKIFSTALVISLVILASGCKKKNDPRTMIYKTWSIEAVDMEGDNAGQDAAMATNTIEFTKKGAVKLVEGDREIAGTYVVNESATSLTTTMEGSTDTFVVSGLSETNMTLTMGGESMILKAK